MTVNYIINDFRDFLLDAGGDELLEAYIAGLSSRSLGWLKTPSVTIDEMVNTFSWSRSRPPSGHHSWFKLSQAWRRHAREASYYKEYRGMPIEVDYIKKMLPYNVDMHSLEQTLL